MDGPYLETGEEKGWVCQLPRNDEEIKAKENQAHAAILNTKKAQDICKLRSALTEWSE